MAKNTYKLYIIYIYNCSNDKYILTILQLLLSNKKLIKLIFTKGNVRAESYTRPRQYYRNGIVNSAQESRQETFGLECTPDPTLGEALQDTDEPLNLDDDEEELLHRLATRHYYK